MALEPIIHFLFSTWRQGQRVSILYRKIKGVKKPKKMYASTERIDQTRDVGC